MTLVTWIVRLLVVVLLTAFAIRNAEIVVLKTFLGYEWQTPLVLALLAFFLGGVVVGLLGLLGTVFRLKREIAQLKRTHEQALEAKASIATSMLNPVPPQM